MRCHGIVRYCTAVLFQAQIALAHLMAGIHEAVERVLGKGDNAGLQVDLHEEGALCEDGGKRDEKDTQRGEVAKFVGICGAKNTAFRENIAYFSESRILRLVGLCYIIFMA